VLLTVWYSLLVTAGSIIIKCLINFLQKGEESMKKIFKGLFAVLAFTTVFAAAELKAADDIGLTVGVDYWSNYLFRGQYQYYGEGAFFPYASYDILGSGLTIGVVGEIAETWLGGGSEDNSDPSDSWPGYLKYQHALDVGLDYEYEIEGTATLGVGVWHYRYKDNFQSYTSGYVTASLDMVPFVTPFVQITGDYYWGDKATAHTADDYGVPVGTKYKDIFGNDDRSNLYIQAGITKNIEVTKDVASIDLGAVVGYAHYRALGNKIDDISDIDLSATFSLTEGMVTLTGGFHYVIVPGNQFKNTSIHDYQDPISGNDIPDKDIHRFYATFGASCSI
jgi:hypothetical protein